MPLETLQQPVRQPARRTALAAKPVRLRPKGPVGPEYYRQVPAAAGRPKQSAVERLEADKAKYVKSQVALSKREPVKTPDMIKPLLNSALRPTRKTSAPATAKKEGVQLDMEHLTNLISDVNDGPPSSPATDAVDGKAPDCDSSSHGSPCPSPAGGEREGRPRVPPRPSWSGPAKVRLKASEPAKVEGPSSSGPPAVGTVRRVDVMPQGGPARARRPPLYIRQPLQPIPLHSQIALRPTTSQLHLFHPRTTSSPSPLKPGVAPLKPDNPPSPPAGGAIPVPPSPSVPFLPPASPAITRLSSSSSRKRPSLTRSKSDMSDMCSRAGTDLERFFNLCGLDPGDLQELTGSSSDIVSMARFRSVSAPGSECVASAGEDDNAEEEAGNAAGRAPYGVSIIERNARVIKWLYSLRHAKDNASKSTNL